MSNSSDILAKKRAWWKFINNRFWRIFRDVVRGIICLYDQNTRFGDVENGIFVDSNGGGKILPCVQPSLSGISDKELDKKMNEIAKSDIELLYKKMIEMTQYPFDGADRSDGPNWDCFDARWIFDSTYLMNGHERVKFILKIRAALRQKGHLPDQFTKMLYKEKSFVGNSWQNAIPNTGRYRTILDGAKALNNTSYKSLGGLIRYTNSVCTHYNEGIKGQTKWLNYEELDRDWTKFFPKLFSGLSEGLLYSLKNSSWDVDRKNAVVLPLLSVRDV